MIDKLGADAERARARWFKPLPLLLLDGGYPQGPHPECFRMATWKRRAEWHRRLRSRLAANANPERRALVDLTRELDLHRRRWRPRPVHMRMRLKRRPPRKFYPGKWRSVFTERPVPRPRKKTRWGV